MVIAECWQLLSFLIGHGCLTIKNILILYSVHANKTFFKFTYVGIQVTYLFTFQCKNITHSLIKLKQLNILKLQVLIIGWSLTLTAKQQTTLIIIDVKISVCFDSGKPVRRAWGKFGTGLYSRRYCARTWKVNNSKSSAAALVWFPIHIHIYFRSTYARGRLEFKFESLILTRQWRGRSRLSRRLLAGSEIDPIVIGVKVQSRSNLIFM